MKSRLNLIWLVAASLCPGTLTKSLRDALPSELPESHSPANGDETQGEWPHVPASAEEMTAVTSETKDTRRLQVVSPPVAANPAAMPTPTQPASAAPKNSSATSSSFYPIDPPLRLVGSNGQPASAYPLNQCQGQCIYDDDCRGSLKCFKIFEADPSIPGCSGVPELGQGYCFDLADYPPDKPNNGTGFRMKLYWEKGYFWQGETFDRRWCFLCGVYCVVRFCNDPDVARFEFIPNKYGSQIKVTGTNFCFERYRKQYIIEQYCNASKPTQWFTGRFNSSKFEIHPYGMPRMCVAQNHHPRIGELIYVQDCASSRASTTNYWMRY